MPSGLGVCYTRSTPSYKLLSEYNLHLTQRLTSYPLVLVGLSCGCSIFAKVTDELPLVGLWLLGVLRVTNELSLVGLWLLCIAGN
jgi:hypothetical protein